MWDLVGATVGGVLTGLVFEFYFRRAGAGAGSAGGERG
jgi:hypothetical protein